ncbi:hypothetical protein LJC19_00180 [Oxalobacter sp. OttesenSCG-928-P03]|nr:hypothetical protein [Oxalobacter sp. OttesenSCG-928-P03]
MEKKFKAGAKYSGEVVYGGCAGNGTNSITVLKRDDKTITYQDGFGKANAAIREATIETLEDWGEYVTIGDDRFFAYSVENA